MRKRKSLLGALLSVLLLHVMFLPVKAAQLPEADTYSIRIFAGQQGTMTECSGGNGRITEDGKTFILNGLGYGERVSVSYALVRKGDNADTADSQYNYFVLTVRQGESNDPAKTSTIRFRTESKYNVIGSRESGKDNSERVGSEPIVRDKDYVIAYGLMKDAVEYTIHYVDTAGNTLRPSDKYYGTVGDMPVVSYQYFDGYQPQAYNLTKTLTANAADNVFTFVYSRVTGPGVTVITIPGAPGPTTTPTEGTVTVIPGEEGGAGGGGGGADAPAPDEGGGEDTNLPDEPVPLTPPQETINLDNEDLPLADFDKDENKIISLLNGNAFLLNIPLPVKILVLCVLAAFLGGGIWWLVKSRRKKKEDASEENKSSGQSKRSGGKPGGEV